MILYLMGG